MFQANAYAAASKTAPLRPMTISRRDLRANDLSIEILYCGVCHTHIHTVHAEWDGLIYPQGAIYPYVTGHEIVAALRIWAPTSPDLRRASSSL